MPNVDTSQAMLLARQLLASLAAIDVSLCAHLTPILSRLEPCRHSCDFSTVVWYGTTYQFNATQAAVVALLWEQWKNGTPTVRQERLIDAAGTSPSRLSFVFREHPAWGTLIIPGPVKGTFRLAETG